MRKTYHHERLRERFIEAATAHIEAEGHTGLTVRSLAQLLGVTTAAPYHHFADRRAILLAVAVETLIALIATLEGAAARCSEPEERLRAISNAFLDFADSHPRLFDLIYDSELTRPTLDPALEELYRQAYRRIRQDFDLLFPDDENVSARVVGYWSAIFGYAFLSSHAMLDQFIETTQGSVAARDQVITSALNAKVTQRTR